MQNANPVSTPLDPNVKIAKSESDDGERGRSNSGNDYASLVGLLQYIAIATCPDIAYAVSRLGSYTSNPGLEHYTAAKRVLRYLQGTKDLEITYRRDAKCVTGPNDTNFFYGFADTSYASCEDLKSISEYVYLSNGGALTWGSRKQSIIALSTMMRSPRGQPRKSTLRRASHQRNAKRDTNATHPHKTTRKHFVHPFLPLRFAFLAYFL